MQENWHGADMHALVSAQTGAFEITEDVVRVSGERLLVKPEAAQNIGLSLHELASNALRHGALSSPDGHVEIDWRFVEGDDGKRIQLTWHEFGGPVARLPKRSGFGILVLSTITPRRAGRHRRSHGRRRRLAMAPRSARRKHRWRRAEPLRCV